LILTIFGAFINMGFLTKGKEKKDTFTSQLFSYYALYWCTTKKKHETGRADVCRAVDYLQSLYYSGRISTVAIFLIGFR